MKKHSSHLITLAGLRVVGYSSSIFVKSKKHHQRENTNRQSNGDAEVGQ
jgi:hypothetical protein